MKDKPPTVRLEYEIPIPLAKRWDKLQIKTRIRTHKRIIELALDLAAFIQQEQQSGMRCPVSIDSQGRERNLDIILPSGVIIYADPEDRQKE